MNVFVPHFLQALGCERGTATAAAVADNHSIWIGSLFFDVELDGAAAHVRRAGNVSFVPFVSVTDIYDDCFAAVQFRSGVLRRDLDDVLLRVCDKFLVALVLGHCPNLTTDYTNATDG